MTASLTGRVQGNPRYGLQYSALPFGFAVTRTGSSSAALFNTAGNRVIFKVWPAPLQPTTLLFCCWPAVASIPRVPCDLGSGMQSGRTLVCFSLRYACDSVFLQDQYIELTSSIPSSATLFGLGEYTSNVGFPLRRDGIPYTLWNRDQPPAVPNANLYGSHPIILDIRDGGFIILSAYSRLCTAAQTRFPLQGISTAVCRSNILDLGTN